MNQPYTLLRNSLTFNHAIDKVLKNEGGFQNNFFDRGNWTSGIIGIGKRKGTNYGISAMSFPNLDIKNLTAEKAKTIYFTKYYLPSKAYKLPALLVFDYLDSAILHGNIRAIKILQYALRTKVDGIFGIETERALKPYFDEKYPENLHKLHCRFIGARLRFLKNIPTFKRFGKGWISRIANNLLLQ